MCNCTFRCSFVSDTWRMSPTTPLIRVSRYRSILLGLSTALGGALGDKTENDEDGLLQRYIEMNVLTRIRRHAHDQQQTPCVCESMNGGLSYIAIFPHAGSVSDVVHPTNGLLDCVASGRDFVWNVQEHLYGIYIKDRLRLTAPPYS